MAVKMDQQHRAKQFIPFAALKGYQEALRRKEEIIVSRKVIPVEHSEEIDWKLHQLYNAARVSIVYYDKKKYQKITGEVSEINRKKRTIKVEDSEIPFKEIYDISIE